jgi:uncharacterized protein (DUF885 family)
MRPEHSAFEEGWALYSETLGSELGLYDDPFDRFGQLRMELMRTLRVLIDTGVHIHGWSSEEAMKYFMKQTGTSKEQANFEVSRLLWPWPGFQLAYKVGEMQFRAMRARVTEKLGPQFDVRNFHEAMLRWGPLPFDVLERRCDDCLEEPDCPLLVGPGEVH